MVTYLDKKRQCFKNGAFCRRLDDWNGYLFR
jgi:hypothetical protein